jgi:thioredoxin reductase
MDAITLVFGTEKRGIDIPILTPDFESTVPGIFVVGELGGMGLIRNAVEQGKQAVEAIRRLDGLGRSDQLDLVIVGAGPAGFAASLAAKEHRLRCVTVEQETLGGTVSHYPRGKLVMTAPAKLPLAGKMPFTEVIKEDLIMFWEEVERSTGVKINYRERMEDIKPTAHGFEVKTDRDTYRCRSVLLALGRRGTPRKLGAEGESNHKVVYRMIDPEQYRGQHVLVVGGGDSALEAATSIAAESDTTVTLSYRSEQFSRAKAKNRQKVSEAEQSGRLTVWMKSTVKAITEQAAILKTVEGEKEIDNHAVIVCVGGTLPTPFLEKIGVTVETKYGTP